MRNALLIAYDFPPRRTSGVYRPTYFARHLLSQGWLSTVLTVENREGDIEDATLLNHLPPEITIERTKDLNISGWEETAAEGIRATGGLKSRAKDGPQPLRDRLVRSIGELIRSTFYFPDEYVGWVPGALARAVELNMQHRFDVVYTTSPPRSTPLVGLFLKFLFRLPWVAEFRDPWYLSRRPLRRRFEERLFSLLLKHADAIIAVANGNGGEIRKRLVDRSDRLLVIHNGYNESDFDRITGVSPLLPGGYFHFSHFGTVYPGFSGRFFDGLSVLLKESPELRDRVRINIFGFPDAVVRTWATEGPLKDIVRIHGFVHHEAAIEAMAASNCLLIFLGDDTVSSMTVSGKTYEYLRVGRPVLAIVPGGETAEFIREGQAGWVVSPDDAQGIKQVLRTILADPYPTHATASHRLEFASQFRFDRLAGRVAEVLNSVCVKND